MCCGKSSTKGSRPVRIVHRPLDAASAKAFSQLFVKASPKVRLLKLALVMKLLALGVAGALATDIDLTLRVVAMVSLAWLYWSTYAGAVFAELHKVDPSSQHANACTRAAEYALFSLSSAGFGVLGDPMLMFLGPATTDALAAHGESPQLYEFSPVIVWAFAGIAGLDVLLTCCYGCSLGRGVGAPSQTKYTRGNRCGSTVPKPYWGTVHPAGYTWMRYCPGVLATTLPVVVGLGVKAASLFRDFDIAGVDFRISTALAATMQFPTFALPTLSAIRFYPLNLQLTFVVHVVTAIVYGLPNFVDEVGATLRSEALQLPLSIAHLDIVATDRFKEAVAQYRSSTAGAGAGAGASAGAGAGAGAAALVARGVAKADKEATSKATSSSTSKKETAWVRASYLRERKRSCWGCCRCSADNGLGQYFVVLEDVCSCDLCAKSLPHTAKLLNKRLLPVTSSSGEPTATRNPLAEVELGAVVGSATTPSPAELSADNTHARGGRPVDLDHTRVAKKHARNGRDVNVRYWFEFPVRQKPGIAAIIAYCGTVLTAQAALASDEQKLVRVRAFSYLVSKLTKKATMVVIGNNTYHWRSCAVGFTTALFKGEVYTVWGSNAKPGFPKDRAWASIPDDPPAGTTSSPDLSTTRQLTAPGATPVTKVDTVLQMGLPVGECEIRFWKGVPEHRKHGVLAIVAYVATLANPVSSQQSKTSRAMHFNHLLSRLFSRPVHSCISSRLYHWSSGNFPCGCVSYDNEVFLFYVMPGTPQFYSM